MCEFVWESVYVSVCMGWVCVWMFVWVCMWVSVCGSVCVSDVWMCEFVWVSVCVRGVSLCVWVVCEYVCVSSDISQGTCELSTADDLQDIEGH